jgi:uncharacterized Zn-finger protein
MNFLRKNRRLWWDSWDSVPTTPVERQRQTIAFLLGLHRRSPATEIGLLTTIRQEQTAANLANESNVEATQTTDDLNGKHNRHDDPFERQHDTTLLRPTLSVEVSPSTTVQKDQTTAFWADQASEEAPQATNATSEAIDRVESLSKTPYELQTLQFRCLLCLKNFSRRTTLNNHQRQHTGDRPFLCEFPKCGKSFAQNNDKKRHERSHGGEKVFQCGGTRSDGSSWGCGKAFMRKDGLLEHHHKTVKGRKCLARRDAGLGAG